MKKLIVLILLIGVIAVAGCISGSFLKKYGVEGTYLKNNNPDHSLELHKDHTYTKIYISRWSDYAGGLRFEKKERPDKEWGTWKIEGNKIIFTVSEQDNGYPGLPPGYASTYEIIKEDDILKLKNLVGDEWVKQ